MATKGFRFSGFKTDQKKEVDGVWMEYSPELRLKVARMGNPKYESRMAELRRPHIVLLRRNQSSPTPEADALVTDLLQKAVSETVLLGWEGLIDDKDQPIPYSAGKALELFKEAPDFFDAVLGLARDVSHFRLESLEQATGN